MLIVPACAAPDPAATPDVTDAWQPLDAVIVDAVLYDVRAKEPDTPDSGPSDIPEPDAAETPDVVDPLPPPEPFVAYGPAQSARPSPASPARLS